MKKTVLNENTQRLLVAFTWEKVHSMHKRGMYAFTMISYTILPEPALFLAINTVNPEKSLVPRNCDVLSPLSSVLT